MKYKYQMHTHTAPCSACAAMTPNELIKSLHSGGYSGCVITNHFYNGNSGINRNLPCIDFIKQYENDYYECKKAAEQYGLSVLFGIEEQLFDGLEILCYGITPHFLYKNQNLLSNHSAKAWYNALKDFGAVCVQAHPFRDRAYITNPRILPLEYIDGIEVFNYSNKPGENIKAANFASDNPNLILVSGADAHTGDIVCCAGIESDIKINDEKTLAYVLKSKQYKLLK